MSTAFYPTNMRAMPSGGINHGSTLENIPYVPWKGTGIFSNPVGVTSTHIRPLTNNDPGNVFPTGFGLPRPIKHYRKGTVIPINFNVITVNPQNPGQYVEQSLIEYNVNRAVKSSNGSSLGGGNGGTGLISQLIDTPGSFIVKDNKPENYSNNNIVGLGEINGLDNSGKNIDKECTNCNGVGIVSSWYPINNLNEKPEPNVTNPLLCCNQQRKARQRVLPTNTNVKKNYYQTTYMYLYNRCQTFKQREFNFITGPVDQKILNLFLTYPFVTAKILEYSKPGDPLSIVNQYVAQCNPNNTIEIGAEIAFINSLSLLLLESGFITPSIYTTLLGQSTQQFITSLQSILTEAQYKIVIEYLYQLAANPYNGTLIGGPSNPKGCSKVMYKPNNPQYAKQGAVSSSTRLLKLNVDTISTNAASLARYQGGNSNGYVTANQLYAGNNNINPFIYKGKTNLVCQPQTYTGNPFFFQGQHQNKLICITKTNGQEYHTYNSVNSGSAGNYIGSTQASGSGYANKSQISNTTYFDNIRHSRNNRFQLETN